MAQEKRENISGNELLFGPFVTRPFPLDGLGDAEDDLAGKERLKQQFDDAQAVENSWLLHDRQIRFHPLMIVG